MRRHLRQHLSESLINHFHCRLTILHALDVGLIPVFVSGLGGKIADADTHACKWHTGNVIAVLVAIADPPLPSAKLVQSGVQVMG